MPENPEGKVPLTTNAEALKINASSLTSLAVDGVTAGTAPGAAGTEVTPTQPQTVTATQTQVATSAPTDGISASAEIPANSPALAAQTRIVR